MLINQHQLEAVVKLPSGVFKPYAGVSTAILFFTKDGKTKDVWFYDLQADGLSLDDKRLPIQENDLPDVRRRWAMRDSRTDTDRKAKAFFVPVDEIRTRDYDLSISRYKESETEAIAYDPPQVILERLAALDAEIARGRAELEGMLG
jgi:type I restriction enzyme M protein